MSNPRTVDDIHKEYSNLAAKAGHVNYNIFVLTNDLKLLNDQMRDLNIEAAKVQAEAKPAEAPANE